MARQVLLEILLGGVQLTEEGAKAACEQGLSDLGCTLTMPLQVATLGQRIDAAKAIIQTGVGFKTDHTSDDEPLRRAVVVFPEWQDRKPLNPPAKGALPSGKPSGNGGKRKGNNRKRATKKK